MGFLLLRRISSLRDLFMTLYTFSCFFAPRTLIICFADRAFVLRLLSWPSFYSNEVLFKALYEISLAYSSATEADDANFMTIVSLGMYSH